MNCRGRTGGCTLAAGLDGWDQRGGAHIESEPRGGASSVWGAL